MSQAAVSGSAPRVTDRVTEAPVRRRIGSGALRPILMLGGILVVIVGAGYYWLTGGRIVSIDDAYVRAAKEVQPGVLVFRLRDQTPSVTEVLGTLQVRPKSNPATIASFSLRAVPSPRQGSGIAPLSPASPQ